MLRHCAYMVTFVPSVLRWRLAETKPGARRTETSVASVRSSTSRRWLAGSTVNTLIRVITSLFAEIVVIVSLPSKRVELVPGLHVMHLLTGDEVGRSLQEGPQVLALHVDKESFGAAPATAYARLTDLEFSAFNRLPLAAQSSAPHA